jgi:prolyl-tRNA synthetase
MTGASFLDEDGTEQPLWMGCYGIGVSRLLGVLAEAHHDDKGLTWPKEVAPFDVHLVTLGANRNPALEQAGDALYSQLLREGFSVLYDDRDGSPGVKFADADLLGVPIRLVLGGKGLERGIVEWRRRRDDTEGEVALSGPFTDLR